MDSKTKAIRMIDSLMPYLSNRVRIIYNGEFFVNGIKCTIDNVREVVISEYEKRGEVTSSS